MVKVVSTLKTKIPQWGGLSKNRTYRWECVDNPINDNLDRWRLDRGYIDLGVILGL